jgi:hypothetical protein
MLLKFFGAKIQWVQCECPAPLNPVNLQCLQFRGRHLRIWIEDDDGAAKIRCLPTSVNRPSERFARAYPFFQACEGHPPVPLHSREAPSLSAELRSLSRLRSSDHAKWLRPGPCDDRKVNFSRPAMESREGQGQDHPCAAART